MRSSIRARAALLFAGALVTMNGITSQDTSAARGQATRSVVYGTHGMVCAAQPLAVQAGIDMLKQGGSAVDAAIATNACLGLMEPTANGLGGDLFAIVWDPEGEEAGRTQRLRPLAAGPARRADPAREGRHDPALLARTRGAFPAASTAGSSCTRSTASCRSRPCSRRRSATREQGFPLSPVIADDWGRSVPALQGQARLRRGVHARRARAGARARSSGTRRWRRRCALIAEGGREAFYEGAIAEEIVAYSRTNGGFFAKEDFAKHTLRVGRAGVDRTTAATTSGSCRRTGQGIAALQMLNLLEGYDLKAMGRESADFWHVMVEAKKLAFADRARYYADPDVRAGPGRGADLQGRTRRERAQADRHGARRDDRRARRPAPVAPRHDLPVRRRRRRHDGLADPEQLHRLRLGLRRRRRSASGCRTAATSSTSRRASPTRYAPGKRPFHTIIPAFVTKDGAAAAWRSASWAATCSRRATCR